MRIERVKPPSLHASGMGLDLGREEAVLEQAPLYVLREPVEHDMQPAHPARVVLHVRHTLDHVAV